MVEICTLIVISGLAVLLGIFINAKLSGNPVIKINRCENCSSYCSTDATCMSYGKIERKYFSGSAYTRIHPPCSEANKDGKCMFFEKKVSYCPELKIPLLLRIKQMSRCNQGCVNCLNYVDVNADEPIWLKLDDQHDIKLHIRSIDDILEGK